MTSKLFIIIFFIAFVIVMPLNAANIRTVALTGEPAPGTPDGVVFRNFQLAGGPYINARGKVAMRAFLGGVGIDDFDQEGLWSEAAGSLRLVARVGDQAPGLPDGVKFSTGSSQTFGSFILNSAGEMEFIGFASGSGLARFGIWTGGSGQLTLLASTGQSAPGIQDTQFSFLKGVTYNSSGHTAFAGGVLGSGIDVTNHTGLWSDRSGSLELVARQGDRVPGTPEELTFGSFSLVSGQTSLRTRMNALNHLAFRISVDGPGVDSTNDLSIWYDDTNTLQLVSREGSQAAGMPAGVSYGILFDPQVNSSGQIAFGGIVNGDGVDSSNDWAFWSGNPDAIRLVQREGDQAPGFPEGVHFGSAGGQINSEGEFASVLPLRGPGVDGNNNYSIWTDISGSLEMIAREGDQAPDLPEGLLFRNRDGFANPFAKGLALNSRGQIAFGADINGPFVGSSSDEGIWATDVNGVLRLIVREGDELEVRPGDFRRIQSLYFVDNVAGNENGSSSGFNNNGQLAFYARFFGGSQGIFVSDLVAVPEPSNFLLSVIALCGMRSIRKSGDVRLS